MELNSLVSKGLLQGRYQEYARCHQLRDLAKAALSATSMIPLLASVTNSSMVAVLAMPTILRQ